MEQSPSWEDDSSLASQDIFCNLWNKIHKGRQHVPVLSQINPDRAPTPLLDDSF